MLSFGLNLERRKSRNLVSLSHHKVGRRERKENDLLLRISSTLLASQNSLSHLFYAPNTKELNMHVILMGEYQF